MLYPQENKIRGIIDLNGVWDFALGTTEEPKDTVTLPDQMEPIAVPASYNDQKDDIAYRNHYVLPEKYYSAFLLQGTETGASL